MIFLKIYGIMCLISLMILVISILTAPLVDEQGRVIKPPTK